MCFFRDIMTESLILAQNERWRRVLNMQVGREPLGLLRGFSGERVSNTWIIYLWDGDNSWKRLLIPNKLGCTQVYFRKGGDLLGLLPGDESAAH